MPTSGLSQPAGVAVDAEGDLFIADAKNNRVVEVMPDGTQITIGSDSATRWAWRSTLQVTFSSPIRAMAGW